VVRHYGVHYILAALTVNPLLNIQMLDCICSHCGNGGFSTSALREVLVKDVLIVGFQRAAILYEAGVGSAAIAT